MEVFSHIAVLFREPWLIALIAAGTWLGRYVGSVPGLSAAMTVSLLAAFTFGWEQFSAFAVMIGVYVGAVSSPTPKSIFGSLLGVLALATLAPLIARFTGNFQPIAFLVLSFLRLIVSSWPSVRFGLVAGCIGLFLGFVGGERFTFNINYLNSGVDYIVAMIGLFGASEALSHLADIKATPVAPVQEFAKNAALGGALIPTLALGIPGNSVNTVLLSALMFQGVRPGPNLIPMMPDLFWFIVASLFIAALLVMAFGLTFKAFSKIPEVPKEILIPTILALCALGAFAIRNSLEDICVMFAFGVFGFFLRRYDYPVESLALGLVLARLCEG
ncbi:MAG: tripartite tricarboxylate transporter permease [Synergistaceae bacterium]|nr:tripartite tricarboxylate transporter permease [Synergistaceae bacterium]